MNSWIVLQSADSGDTCGRAVVNSEWEVVVGGEYWGKHTAVKCDQTATHLEFFFLKLQPQLLHFPVYVPRLHGCVAPRFEVVPYLEIQSSSAFWSVTISKRFEFRLSFCGRVCKSAARVNDLTNSPDEGSILSRRLIATPRISSFLGFWENRTKNSSIPKSGSACHEWIYCSLASANERSLTFECAMRMPRCTADAPRLRM